MAAMSATTFTVTLEPAAGSTTPLGLHVRAPNKDHPILVVTELKAGLVANWNRANPSQQILEGDCIVEVNGTSGSTKEMLEVLKFSRRKTLTISREAQSVFEATLVKTAQNQKVGANVVWPDNQTLLVRTVAEQGMIASWNATCRSDAQRIHVSDSIIEINGVSGDAKKMMHELAVATGSVDIKVRRGTRAVRQEQRGPLAVNAAMLQEAIEKPDLGIGGGERGLPIHQTVLLHAEEHNANDDRGCLCFSNKCIV
jgi:hypothetical protein